jgi:hypothetical protein
MPGYLHAAPFTHQLAVGADQESRSLDANLRSDILATVPAS